MKPPMPSKAASHLKKCWKGTPSQNKRLLLAAESSRPLTVNMHGVEYLGGVMRSLAALLLVVLPLTVFAHH
jgi:hypothetical protein